MSVSKPLGSGVVEPRQRTAFQFDRRIVVARYGVLRATWAQFDPVHQLWRVQPASAQLDETAGRLAYGTSVGVFRIVGSREVWRKAARKREVANVVVGV